MELISFSSREEMEARYSSSSSLLLSPPSALLPLLLLFKNTASKAWLVAQLFSRMRMYILIMTSSSLMLIVVSSSLSLLSPLPRFLLASSRALSCSCSIICASYFSQTSSHVMDALLSDPPPPNNDPPLFQLRYLSTNPVNTRPLRLDRLRAYSFAAIRARYANGAKSDGSRTPYSDRARSDRGSRAWYNARVCAGVRRSADRSSAVPKVAARASADP
mmetsp:Transcript_38524/g.81044  ORF Transcript_38524/g.81044 Transcript_38524/m.81044 type:complete len:218 (-) Transcript_38524:441-1094(-)